MAKSYDYEIVKRIVSKMSLLGSGWHNKVFVVTGRKGQCLCDVRELQRNRTLQAELQALVISEM